MRSLKLFSRCHVALFLVTLSLCNRFFALCNRFALLVYFVGPVLAITTTICAELSETEAQNRGFIFRYQKPTAPSQMNHFEVAASWFGTKNQLWSPRLNKNMEYNVSLDEVQKSILESKAAFYHFLVPKINFGVQD